MKKMKLLSITALFLIGCSSTTKVRYIQPDYYEFNLTKIELELIPKINIKEHIHFSDKSRKNVNMPTWFLMKLLDVNDVRTKYLEIYKKFYDWTWEDNERYKEFVKKQKKFLKEKNKH